MEPRCVSCILSAAATHALKATRAAVQNLNRSPSPTRTRIGKYTGDFRAEVYRLAEGGWQYVYEHGIRVESYTIFWSSVPATQPPRSPRRSQQPAETAKCFANNHMPIRRSVFVARVPVSDQFEQRRASMAFSAAASAFTSCLNSSCRGRR